jgi:phytoene/squalene synthetase
MDLDTVAERFGLDSVFSYYPFGATIDDLAEIANACESFFEHDDWLICQDYEQYIYISASAIIELVAEQADSFKRYYEMVGK